MTVSGIKAAYSPFLCPLWSLHFSFPCSLMYGDKQKVCCPTRSLSEGQNASLPFLEEPSVFRCHSVLNRPSHTQELCCGREILLPSLRSPLMGLIQITLSSSSQVERLIFWECVKDRGMVYLGRVGSRPTGGLLSSDLVFVHSLWAQSPISE